MWIVVMFDLPVDTKESRKRAADFRHFLLSEGYLMLQFSVYARHCASFENAEVHLGRVQGEVPPDGHVRIFQFTDKQFQKQLIYFGKIRESTDSPPEQLTFF